MALVFPPNNIIYNNCYIMDKFDSSENIVLSFDYKMDLVGTSNEMGGFSVVFSKLQFTPGGDPIYGLGYKPATDTFLQERLEYIHTIVTNNDIHTINNDDIVNFPDEYAGLRGGWAGVGFDPYGKFTNGPSATPELNTISTFGPQEFGFNLIEKASAPYDIINNEWISYRVILQNNGRTIDIEYANTTDYKYNLLYRGILVAPSQNFSNFDLYCGIIFSSPGKKLKFQVRNLSYTGKISQ